MPEIRETRDDIERRFVAVELRALTREADKAPVIAGVAAVYDQETVIGDWFRESIRAGAFTRLLSEKPDVIGAFNHNWDMVLGRTVAGSLRLIDGPEGLGYEIDVNANDPEAMSVYAKVQRGDVRQSSFAFTVRASEWTNPPKGSTEMPLRTILEIDTLYDVSPVTFPAYPQTSAAVRSKVEAFRQQQPPAAEQAALGGAEDSADAVAVRQKARRRRLELAERS